MSKHLSPSKPPVARGSDYFVEVIGELADQARDLGEVEASLHLEAIAQARQHALKGFEAGASSPPPIRQAERQRSV